MAGKDFPGYGVGRLSITTNYCVEVVCIVVFTQVDFNGEIECWRPPIPPPPPPRLESPPLNQFLVSSCRGTACEDSPDDVGLIRTGEESVWFAGATWPSFETRFRPCPAHASVFTRVSEYFPQATRLNKPQVRAAWFQISEDRPTMFLCFFGNSFRPEICGGGAR